MHGNMRLIQIDRENSASLMAYGYIDNDGKFAKTMPGD
jgi:hypothetical protein